MRCLVPVLLLLAACAEPEGTPPSAAADIVLINARVVTMDAADSVAEAIAISGERIAAVGPTADILALADDGTEVLNLGGNTVTPGIIDTHNHFAIGTFSEQTDIEMKYPAVTSIGDVRDRIREAVRSSEPGEWIDGANWDGAKLAERRDILAADIDDISPDNPVWLSHTSGHYGVANSAAMRVAGIDRNTPDPDGGVIGRREDGSPNGLFIDQARHLIGASRPPITAGDLATAIANGVAGLNAEGITAIKDPEIDGKYWDAYNKVADDGALTVRVTTLWRVPDTVQEARDLLTQIQPFTNPAAADGSALVVSGGVKIYIDGSGTARTAWMHDDWNMDYTGTDEGNTGLTYLSTELLFDQIRLYHDAGIHIGTHAIGDRAIDFTLDAYDRVLSDNPIRSLRHSIIHSNLPTGHALDLMVKLQRDYDAAYPEIQPAFLWWIGDVYVGNFGPDRSLRVLPLRTFGERGIKWAGASDYDVSPYAPRHAFWAAATRQTLLGTWGESPWGTDESVSIHDTLRAYTATAARQIFLEDEVGTLEVGKRADIVAWDRDLYAIPVDELREARPVLTLLNGEPVFQASRQGFGIP